jgi:hypothetical protein
MGCRRVMKTAPCHPLAIVTIHTCTSLSSGMHFSICPSAQLIWDKVAVAPCRRTSNHRLPSGRAHLGLSWTRRGRRKLGCPTWACLQTILSARSLLINKHLGDHWACCKPERPIALYVNSTCDVAAEGTTRRRATQLVENRSFHLDIRLVLTRKRLGLLQIVGGERVHIAGGSGTGHLAARPLIANAIRVDCAQV